MGDNEMTICEPFRFWTNEIPLANVIRGLCFHLMLACVACTLSITMQSRPTNAAQADQTGEAVEAASLDGYKICSDNGGGVVECASYYWDVDPGANRQEKAPSATLVDRFHLELSFDPTQFKFDPRQSGPLCSFADGGSPCPQSQARLGKSLIRENDTQPGIPPAGAMLCFSQPRSGVIVVDYTLPTPVDLSTDQNIFRLAFDLVKPIPTDVRVYATYFGEPGDHQFNQIAFSCNGGAIRCTGVPPILGFDISNGTQPNLQ
jgi:hypothetical protein